MINTISKSEFPPVNTEVVFGKFQKLLLVLISSIMVVNSPTFTLSSVPSLDHVTLEMDALSLCILAHMSKSRLVIVSEKLNGGS